MRVVMRVMVAVVVPMMRRRQRGARKQNQRDSDCDKLTHRLDLTLLGEFSQAVA
jgi:hypothetical protein